MSDPTARHPEPDLDLFAAGLAWLLPGLGHFKLGQRRRGILIMFGVLFMFLGGVLVGGVDCVDRKRDKLWFMAQAVCGPVAFAADYVNQRYTKTLPRNWEYTYSNTKPGDQAHDEIVAQLKTISLGRVNEAGTLFCALAGLMNLVAILDALYCIPKAAPPLVERRKAAAP
jgi:hypothetical protein